MEFKILLKGKQEKVDMRLLCESIGTKMEERLLEMAP